MSSYKTHVFQDLHINFENEKEKTSPLTFSKYYEGHVFYSVNEHMINT